MNNILAMLLSVLLFIPVGFVYADALENNDEKITQYIRASIIADPAISYLNVNVRTVDGIVSLTGKVDSVTQKENIEKIARGVTGVVRVDSWLTVTGLVRPPGTSPLPEQQTGPPPEPKTVIKVVPVPVPAPQPKPPIANPENEPIKRGY